MKYVKHNPWLWTDAQCVLGITTEKDFKRMLKLNKIKVRENNTLMFNVREGIIIFDGIKEFGYDEEIIKKALRILKILKSYEDIIYFVPNKEFPLFIKNQDLYFAVAPRLIYEGEKNAD